MDTQRGRTNCDIIFQPNKSSSSMRHEAWGRRQGQAMQTDGPEGCQWDGKTICLYWEKKQHHPPTSSSSEEQEEEEGKDKEERCFWRRGAEIASRECARNKMPKQNYKNTQNKQRKNRKHTNSNMPTFNCDTGHCKVTVHPSQGRWPISQTSENNADSTWEKVERAIDANTLENLYAWTSLRPSS